MVMVMASDRWDVRSRDSTIFEGASPNDADHG